MTLATKILLGMLAGLIVGIVIKILPQSHFVDSYIVNGFFDAVGKIFIALLEMLVVPIVLVSLVCGTCSLGDSKKLGRLGAKTLLIFISTTVIAIIIGLFLATIFHIGDETRLTLQAGFHAAPPVSFKQTIINMIPSNPIKAMGEGNLLQIIIFALLLGVAISMAGESGKRISDAFNALNDVLMNLITIVMKFAPFGVFCLIAEIIAQIGLGVISDLFFYILVVLGALAIQLFVVYSIFLAGIGRINPKHFFKKMYSVMLFAFSTSSSNATIPLNLETTTRKLGVSNSIASFVIPLGATINMDGTAIMQGVASVFIAHLYHIHLSLAAYFTIVVTATLASIGTAGVPGVGIITLAMVLQQVGLPLDGIGIIIGVDRLMDMFRTIINISGDTMTACLVAKTEKAMNLEVYNNDILASDEN